MEWRVLAHRGDEKVEVENEGVFDELVVDQWLHVEQMDHNIWWLRIGDAKIDICISSDGLPTVDIQRGFYDKINGITNTYVKGD